MFWQIICFFYVDTCGEGHSIEKIQRMFVWSSTNAPLNNFCSKENNKNNKLSKRKNQQNFVSVTYFSVSIIGFLNLSIVCI